jgi:TonB family protein
LHCLISAEGKVLVIGVQRGVASDLDAQAVKAVQQWQFHPSTGPDGKPIAATIYIEVSFAFL